MNFLLFLEQILNGLQFGVFLFLISAGLTLVLGIMNVVNLAHGALYMMGAYFAATFFAWTGSLWIAFFLMIPASLAIGMAVEVITLRRLYDRDHMDQVLATFGLILFFNEGVKLIWGVESQNMPIPEALSSGVEIFPDAPYPTYRLAIIGVGLLVAVVLYFFISRTRTGMLIRAGASNGPMIRALGVNIRLLYTVIFGIGAFFAGLAGLMAGPILSVEPGMGDDMLILAFVVIVIGGIGSIRGALVASILVGVFEVVGRSYLPALLDELLSSDVAQTVGPALASMLIYILMILVLFFRPQGLFPARTG
ncbi:MAG: branched-chain amino acid ABC transporter permease [Rhodospirillales bacterium]|jgi:branched-chain amino acid transport system permease protein|nr:branched-chain amino acid ABC transporter permease [Rhodospirillaceae bacterium]MDP6426914.1 branched-chain amino acid ABC transporter permease [Rhodospirillales bacterium]MDP6645385.1 branched-chain amino acid ABC transporter permease [Rhodospirillales bacterium]|tara:strand:- start:822 stop:1745 length:924 start_codon:yes stop_codon:yes gene_type:complete